MHHLTVLSTWRDEGYCVWRPHIPQGTCALHSIMYCHCYSAHTHSIISQFLVTLYLLFSLKSWLEGAQEIIRLQDQLASLKHRFSEQNENAKHVWKRKKFVFHHPWTRSHSSNNEQDLEGQCRYKPCKRPCAFKIKSNNKNAILALSLRWKLLTTWMDNQKVCC
jgi:hypothetical protein